MNLLKTYRTYKWFSRSMETAGSPGLLPATDPAVADTREELAIETTTPGKKRVPASIIGNIIEVVRLTDEHNAAPTYKIVLVEDGTRLRGIRQTVADQREFLRSTQVLVFAAAGDTEDAVNETMAALGTAMVTAALTGVDSTSIEDFDSGRIDELLGLGAQGFHSVALLPLH